MTSPLREANSDARRARILEAATRRCAQNAFNETTVHDIASEPGISEGPMYL